MSTQEPEVLYDPDADKFEDTTAEGELAMAPEVENADFVETEVQDDGSELD
jgi:hypothetical protein